jgi:lipopolysaccharide/colanic/teichoic acid biosynthesis glycosyltransferase
MLRHSEIKIISIRDINYGLYVEDYFNELLSIERKRSERSKNPFLLILINIKNINSSNGKNKIIKTIASSLFSLTRETDITGWYEYRSIVGVLLTEIGNIETNGGKTIYHKIVNCLNDKIHSEQVKQIKMSTHFFPEKSYRQSINNSSDLEVYPDLPKRKSNKRNYLFLKRALDVTGSVLSFVIFSPFFLIIPILIKLTSKGPVLFKQERIGLHGKKFIFLKFRSMYINNDVNHHREYVKNFINGRNGDDNGEKGKQKEIYKLKSDPRITPLGKFLRRTSLDELPQCINVLKGEMSLVGARPALPYEIEEYDIWHRRRFIEMKPGITGLWQVNGRSSTTFEEMVRLDLKYMRECSLMLDIVILLKTPWAVISCKGAY